MAVKKIKSAIIFSTVAVAIIYIGLWVFPIHMIYDFKSIEETVYEPGSIMVVEIGKKLVFLPGPHTLWTLKTPDGYDVYRHRPL